MGSGNTADNVEGKFDSISLPGTDFPVLKVLVVKDPLGYQKSRAKEERIVDNPFNPTELLRQAIS